MNEENVQCFICGRKGTRGFRAYSHGGVGNRVSFAKKAPRGTVPAHRADTVVCANEDRCWEMRRRSQL